MTNVINRWTDAFIAEQARLAAPLVNDCVICDAAEKAAREGRKSFSVSVGFDAPMCNDCWDFRMQEMMS